MPPQVHRAAALAAVALVAVALVVLTGCAPVSGGSPATSAGASGTTTRGSGPADLSGAVTVFAAASLTEAFTQLGDEFMALYPGVTVTYNFAGSSGLAAQITSGAPADVFASASPATIKTVVDAGDVAGPPDVFAHNTLQIAVPVGNPADITGLADFTDPAKTIALCAPEVPCGAAAEKVFAAAGLVPAPDTLEQDVKAALNKVRLDEVDAALVYRTDVIASGGAVQGIDFPEATQAVNDYLIAPLTGAPNPDAARAFVELVLSPQGQTVLAGAGFTVG